MTFARLFARPARVVRLQQNHRATQPLRAACQAVLAAAPEVAEAPQSIRLGRRPRLVAVAGEVQQAQWVAAEVQRQGSAGVPLRRQAVLMRTPEQSTVLELELARRGIAFFSACSTRWLESAHIQDFLALLRWLHNPRDRLAGLRVLHMLPGVDTLQADQLLHAMAQAAEPWTPFAQFEPAPAAHAFWASLVALRAQQTEPGRGSWPQRLVQLQDWYELQLPRLYDDAALRQPDIERGVRLGQGSLSCEHFLTELALEPPELAGSHSPPTDGADGLRLLTLDRLQGQEWQSVYILQAPFVPARDVWACEAAAPLAHERRLLHSAMSRARENLFLLVPHAELPDTDAPSKEAAGQPRLFTPGVLDAFEQVTATQLPDERRPTACKPAPPFRWPVGARARAVWR